VFNTFYNPTSIIIIPLNPSMIESQQGQKHVRILLTLKSTKSCRSLGIQVNRQGCKYRKFLGGANSNLLTKKTFLKPNLPMKKALYAFQRRLALMVLICRKFGTAHGTATLPTSQICGKCGTPVTPVTPIVTPL